MVSSKIWLSLVLENYNSLNIAFTLFLSLYSSRTLKNIWVNELNFINTYSSPIHLSNFFFVKCILSESNLAMINFWFAFAWYTFSIFLLSFLNPYILAIFYIEQVPGSWFLSNLTVYILTGGFSLWILTVITDIFGSISTILIFW